ncbi:hypothetical protein GW225_21730 [Escherichia coli]|nr:hypothetical protein [Escherichia coli]
MTSLKTSIKTITYLSDTGCLEIQGASLGWAIFLRQKQKKLIMLPSETMIWQPEFTDKMLSRKPGWFSSVDRAKDLKTSLVQLLLFQPALF